MEASFSTLSVRVVRLDLFQGWVPVQEGCFREFSEILETSVSNFLIHSTFIPNHPQHYRKQ